MKNIIFIISQPRAGSTLLQKILENNKQIKSSDEPWLTLSLGSLLQSDIKISSDYDFTLARDAINNFLKQNNLEDEFNHEMVSLIRKMYGRISENECYFLEKTPRNYFILDYITQYFPEAKVIVLKRNLVSVVSSILNSWHDNNLNAIKSHYKDIFEAPKKIFQYSKNNTQVFELTYQELVLNTDNVLEKLTQYLDLSEPLINHYKVEKDIQFGDTIGVFKSNKVEFSSLEKWKKDTPESLCFYYWYLQNLDNSLKSFFYQDIDELEEIEAFLLSYKDVLSKEKINHLLAIPKTMEEQLIEKEKVIHEKEKMIQQLLQIKDNFETNFYVRILKKLGLIK